MRKFEKKYIWPYALFSAIVLVYNYLFLADGFNGTDEGWLLSLAQRIVDGQQPYKDFYFLINPLVIYVQAGIMALIGENYTLLASRIYWALQMWALAMAFSCVYRKYVNNIELILLLLSSWMISTLLIQYPWYNYEAVFYMSLSIIAFHKRKYCLFGVMAFLAFLSKQNYVLFLPIFFGAILLTNRLVSNLNLAVKDITIKTSLGFAVPALIFIGYLLITGSLHGYIQNIFIYPPQITGRGLLFGIFQNNHVALLYSIPILIGTFFLIYSKSWKWLILPILLGPVMAYMINYRMVFFIYNVAMINHAVTIFLLWRIKRCTDKTECNILTGLLPIQILGSIMVYLSGFSYVGITSSYMGSGIALAVTFCSIKSINISVYKKYTPAILMSFLLVIGGYLKYNHIYRDAPRDQLLTEFKSGKMKGIKTTKRNYQQITDLIKAVEHYTDRGDYILIYPDFPILYYLTDRKNPTSIDWYYWRGLHFDMVKQSGEDIIKHRPKVVFIQKYAEGDFMRSGSPIDYINTKEYAPLFNFVGRYYRMEKVVGDIFLFVPKI